LSWLKHSPQRAALRGHDRDAVSSLHNAEDLPQAPLDQVSAYQQYSQLEFEATPL
jgi:hypothetical protein